jgi:type II secretion system protein E
MHIEDVLLRRGVIDGQQLELARGQSHGRRLDNVIADLGFASEDAILSALAEELGMRCVDLSEFQVDRALLAEFPSAAVFRHSLLPIERHNGSVVVATSDPFDLEAIDELRALSRHALDVVLGRHDDIVRLIKENLGVGGDTINQLVAQRAEEEDEPWQDEHGDASELAELAQTASVVRLVNELLTEALQQHASDIHVEPQEQGLIVRYRIDGVLWVQPVPAEIYQFFPAIVTRLKIMARLNIAEKRRPQDGRMKLRLSGREIDVRVSIIPMLYGEGVVLRLLDKTRLVFNLKNVGMPDDIAATFRKLIAKTHGIILVTGPTGHGKTTTLYSTLNEIKSPKVKIVTIEDPVEYHSEGISQIQVQSKVGLTFAAGLRSILRHDPDVILVGEIRDRETVEIAIQSALTGHLVFSTLHSNDAAGALTRLIDMGVEPYLVASTVTGVMAQRLLRVLCSDCKTSYKLGSTELPPDFPQPIPEQLWQPVGCRKCRATGFAGRTGLFELLPTGTEIQKLVLERASAAQIRQHALSRGFTTLRQCGWQKVREGQTSVEEVLRITEEDAV